MNRRQSDRSSRPVEVEVTSPVSSMENTQKFGSPASKHSKEKSAGPSASSRTDRMNALSGSRTSSSGAGRSPYGTINSREASQTPIQESVGSNELARKDSSRNGLTKAPTPHTPELLTTAKENSPWPPTAREPTPLQKSPAAQLQTPEAILTAFSQKSDLRTALAQPSEVPPTPSTPAELHTAVSKDSVDSRKIKYRTSYYAFPPGPTPPYKGSSKELVNSVKTPFSTRTAPNAQTPEVLDTAIGVTLNPATPATILTAFEASPKTAKDLSPEMKTGYSETSVSQKSNLPYTPIGLWTQVHRKTEEPVPQKSSTRSTSLVGSPLPNEFHEPLVLLEDELNLISADFLLRCKARDQDPSPEDQAALSYLQKNFKNMTQNPIASAKCLRRLIGGRRVYISDAQIALEKIVDMGLITSEELAATPGVETLAVAKADNTVTIADLGDFVQKVLSTR